jgi:hypothetical protein
MGLLNRSIAPGMLRLATLTAAALSVTAAAGCYHTVNIPPATPEIAAKQAAMDSVDRARRLTPPKCRSYVLIVENALPRAVEIYEVGHNDERFIAFAQVGFTEVPMTEGSQQFVARSRGEVMAAATNSEDRSGDRVALQRSCRPY